MTTAYDDDILLATLGAALAPEPVVPGPELLAALYEALEARAGGAEDERVSPVVLLAPAGRRPGGWSGLRRLRHPVAAAVAVGVLATSGVAAAAVATDHLPGPTRTVAFDLGLPVTSPALEQAKATMTQLRDAIDAGNNPLVRDSAVALRIQLAALSPAERAQIEATAAQLLARADALLAVPTGPGVPPAGPGSGASGQGSAGSKSAAGSGSLVGVALGRTTSANQSSSSSGSAKPPVGLTPTTAGSGASAPGVTTSTTPSTPSTGSPGTTGPPATNPVTTPTTTPRTTTTTTTPPRTTTTTEPDDNEKGDS